jgi:DNA-binding Lrp family transcriptional regulator
MVTAYVLVKAETPEADRLLDAVLDIDGVADAHIVAGDVDLIAKVSVESPGAVKTVVAEQIGAIDGVASTQTYVTME